MLCWLISRAQQHIDHKRKLQVLFGCAGMWLRNAVAHACMPRGVSDLELVLAHVPCRAVQAPSHTLALKALVKTLLASEEGQAAGVGKEDVKAALLAKVRVCSALISTAALLTASWGLSLYIYDPSKDLQI